MSQSYEKIGMSSLIRRGLPVSALGLTFYPITMLHYDDFLVCKKAITLRLSTLPVKYISQDYFSAVFSFETDSFRERGDRIGLISRIIRFFTLSLRMEENDELNKNLLDIEEKNGSLSIMSINVVQDGKHFRITPFEFSNVIRPILAKLNGLELPDESENIDLIAANEQKKALDHPKHRLHVNTDDLIASVAYLSHCRERELMDWTVREFELRRSAIERDKRYTMCGQAEMGGMVSFKNGNPAPSWFYDVLDDSLGTQSLSELSFGNAKQKN